ncbi:hypothetical protein [Demetria terragena]|uniref:hypothetical protein n=1 Tax=Demetria terragena TaxID=63959 RepID=UPI0003AA36C7|nr:hypothetical protein [Demetria terragena]
MDWLSTFVTSPGFGGLAAVAAAVIAYRGATKGVRAQNARAIEDRWWEQAKWATEKLAGDDNDVALGLSTLNFLIEHAPPDSNAVAFVRHAVFPVVNASGLLDAGSIVEEHAGEEADHDDSE